MAIWTTIHGKNGLSGRHLRDEDYLDILNRIPLDEGKILDSIIEFNEDRTSVADHNLKDYDEYTRKLGDARKKVASGQKSVWKRHSEKNYRNNVCYFRESDGLGFFVDNDIITLVGPMFIFGSTPCFQKSLSKTSRDYYHSYFKSVLTAFKSNFIIYAPEWYGICDGDTETKSVADLLALEDWKKTSSKTIHSMDYVYYEDLIQDIKAAANSG